MLRTLEQLKYDHVDDLLINLGHVDLTRQPLFWYMQQNPDVLAHLHPPRGITDRECGNGP